MRTMKVFLAVILVALTAANPAVAQDAGQADPGAGSESSAQ